MEMETKFASIAQQAHSTLETNKLLVVRQTKSCDTYIFTTLQPILLILELNNGIEKNNFPAKFD